MRRGGVLSVVCDLIILLGGLGVALYSYVQNPEGWNSGDTLIFFIIGAVGFVSIVLHRLYMITGFRLFRFLYRLIHSAIVTFAAFVIWGLLLVYPGDIVDKLACITFVSMFLLSFLSLISNPETDSGEISARRGGGASLGNYIIFLIVGIIGLIMSRVQDSSFEEITPHTLFVIAVSITLIIIWKLYRRTGHILLKALCMLLDIAILSLVIVGALYVSEVKVYLFFFSPFLLFSFLSLMSYP